MKEKGTTPVISNRKARYQYQISDELEVGIVLQGCEVKMVRKGSFELRDAYCEFREGELWLANSTIPVYPQASHVSHEPIRLRKLLAKKQELKRLLRKVREKGFTVIPLKAYFVNGRVKLEIGLAKGKRQYDKRQTIKKRDIERDNARVRP